MQYGPKRFCRFAVGLLVLSLAQQAYAGKAALPYDVNTALSADTTAALSEKLQVPVPGAQVSSSFGWRKNPVLKRRCFHSGIDFIAKRGAAVYAAGEGTVEQIRHTKDRGLYILIRHDQSLVSGYAHLSAIEQGLQVGDHVDARAPIGKVGSSGRATGPNLHFEVFLNDQRIDPSIALAGDSGTILANRQQAPIMIAHLGRDYFNRAR